MQAYKLGKKYSNTITLIFIFVYLLISIDSNLFKCLVTTKHLEKSYGITANFFNEIFNIFQGSPQIVSHA